MADVIGRLKFDTNDAERKIKDAQKSLEQFGIKGTEAGNKLQTLTNILNINVGKLSLFAGGLGAAAGAFKVVGDAMKQNETFMDAWRGNIEGAKGVYEGFLNALNTGDFSGFFRNIGNIVAAAREAYDALDTLGTFNAFNQIQVEKTRTDFTEAVADFKSGKGSKEAVQQAANAMKTELETRMKLEDEAYIKAVESLATKRGVDKQQLLEIMQGKYGDYKKIYDTMPSGKETRFYSSGQFGGQQSYEVAVVANETERMGEMLRKLNDDELQSLQALGAQAQRTATEVAQVDKQVARYLNETKKDTKPGKVKTDEQKWIDNELELNSIKNLQTGLSVLNKELLNAVDQDARDSATRMIERYKAEIERMKGGASISDKATPAYTGISSGVDMSKLQLNPKGLEIAAQNWENYKKAVIEANKANQQAIGLFGQVAGAISQIDNPAAKILGTIGQAIATVAMAYSDALAKDESSKFNIWSFIAASTAATISMVSTIASIKSATAGSYADGGIIPGNIQSGDHQIAQVNAGELILNKAQQNAIASQLQGGARGGSAQPYVSGEMIWLGLNNYMKRTGRGEIVTSK